MKKHKTKAEKDWMDRVASLGCIVCKNLGFQDSPASLHHIRSGMGMGQRNDNYHILPLCSKHHQTGGYGIALHAGIKRWEEKHGTEMSLYHQLLGELGRTSA